MTVKELIPTPKDKVHFQLASYKFIPKKSGCYILTTFDNDILYIGLSTNLYDRFQQHLCDSEKTKHTKDGKAFWFYYMEYDLKKLQQLERTWINHFKAMHGRFPILNKVNSPLS